MYLDIEGHRNDRGGYDWDMLELQKAFMLGFLGKYLTEIHMPLIGCVNNKLQNSDVPDAINYWNGYKSGKKENDRWTSKSGKTISKITSATVLSI